MALRYRLTVDLDAIRRRLAEEAGTVFDAEQAVRGAVAGLAIDGGQWVAEYRHLDLFHPDEYRILELLADEADAAAD